MSIDAATYRRIVGHFATGVTVVTTVVDGWLHGMTANALTSLSLDPLQLLLCVDKQAHLHQQLTEGGRFCVNILAEDQEEISRLFAVTAEPEQGSLRGAAYHVGPHGLPLLDGCLAFLDCDVAERCEGGDHTIFIGAVVHGEVLREAPPLLFYQGSYRRLQA